MRHSYLRIEEVDEGESKRKMKTINRGELDQTPATEIVKPNLTPVPRELTRIRTRFTLIH